MRGHLLAALAGLRPAERDVLLLYALAGLSYAEIGEALALPPGTVRSHLFRARRALRAELGPEIDHDVPQAPALTGGGGPDERSRAARARIAGAGRGRRRDDAGTATGALPPAAGAVGAQAPAAPVLAAGIALAAAAVLLVSRSTPVATGIPQPSRVRSTASPPSRDGRRRRAPGAYAYIRTRSDYGATGSGSVAGRSYVYSYHTPATSEQWMSASGDIIRCSDDGRPTFKSPSDRSAWLALGSPALDALGGKLGYERFQGTPATLAGTPGDQLPTSPEGIGALVQSLRNHDAGSVLGDVLELLKSTPVSPAATAALFRYLAAVPGLAVVEGAHTHDGRTGVGISVAGNGLTGSERWVNRFLIFDPATSRLIGYRELAPGVTATEPGHDRAWEDYLAQGTAALDVPPVPQGVESHVGVAAERLCAGLARP